MSAAATFAWSHRPRFRDGHVSSAVLGAVEFLNSISGFRIGRHFHEPEPFTAARVTIGDDLRGLDISRLREDFLKRLIRCVERKITNVKLLTHEPPWRRGGHEHHAPGHYRD